jgi:ubiquitin carboxyl-terminal hydrolase 8
MSVVEIKERAIQQAQRASRGHSAISLIRSAKGQISLAQSCENTGDLKGALSAFTKAASLTQVFMDSEEFKAENVPGNRGVLWKELTDFQQVRGTLSSNPFFCLRSSSLARGWRPYAARACCRK